MTTIAVTPGSGAAVAVDTISAESHQLVKVEFGTAGSATQVDANNGLPVAGTATAVPDNTAAGLGVRPIGEDIVCASFTDVGSSLVSPLMTQHNLGTGMGVTQSSGNLLVTTGTTANADFLARSNAKWRGAWQMKQKTTLSQRIANNNFWVLLADLVGTALAVTVNSATSISVTKTGHGLTANNVGQFMCIGAMTLAGCPPGRYAIASLPDANTINFTVAGFPASGSTTCTLFGWSHCKISYSGTTSTSAFFDCQRYGWASGDTTLTINTTAAPGHVAQVNNNGRDVVVHDTLSASSTTPNVTTRGSRIENMPDDNLDLYLFLWAFNGTSAPASTTTWTVGFWSVEKYANLPVYIQGARMQGTSQGQPVQVVNALPTGANSIGNLGTVTTVTTCSTLTTLANGQAAHSAASTGSPVRVAGRVNTAVDTTLVAGDVSDLFMTSSGAAVVKPYSVPEVDWTFAGATGGIVNTTTAVTVKAAAAAGIRNYVTGLSISTDTLGAATEFAIRDGAAGTVLYRCKLQTAALPETQISFPTPLKGTAATLLEVVTLTATTSGGVYVNLQGYTAP